MRKLNRSMTSKESHERDRSVGEARGAFALREFRSFVWKSYKVGEK